MSAGFQYSPAAAPAPAGGMVETMWATTVADFVVTGSQAYDAQWGPLTSFGADPPTLGGAGNDTVIIEASGYHVVTLSGFIAANLPPAEDFVAAITVSGSGAQYIPYVHTGTFTYQAITPLTLGLYLVASAQITAQVFAVNMAGPYAAQLGLSISRIGASLDTAAHSPLPL